MGFTLKCSQGSANAPLKVQSRIIKQINGTELHEGADNNNGSGLQKGFIHSQEYTFQIVQYADSFVPTDADKSDIKWVYFYDNDGGGTVRVLGQQGGESFTFKTDSLELCGKLVKFEVYFSPRCGEDKYTFEIFHHYRFRYFDRKRVEQQAQNRTTKPWLIDQGQTSLCGMACIFYILAKNNPNKYLNLVKDLHRTGKARINNYTVEPNQSSLKMYDTDPTSSTHPFIPEVDWITMATTRSKESSLGYTGQKGQDFSAINWWWVMTKLGKKLLGYKTVEMDFYKINKSYIRDFFDSDEKLRILEEDIDKDYKNGYEICMMIDADMVNNKADYDLTDVMEYHWIVYEGDLNMSSSKNNPETDYDEVEKIKFKSFTWGENVGTSRTKKGISKAAYRNNYHGYLKLK